MVVSTGLVVVGGQWRRPAGGTTNLEVLNEIVEHFEPFRVIRVLHVNQRSNLGRLRGDGRGESGGASA